MLHSKTRRCVLYTIMCLFISSLFLFETGLYQYMLVIPYQSSYWGPAEPLVNLIQHLKENSSPDVLPVNEFSYSYSILNEQKCNIEETIRLLYVVKSSLPNFYKREIIRQSWGYEQRFSDVTIKTVFLLGHRPDQPHLQFRINKESKQHKDIIQADFVDNYYNNTIKAMMGLHWAFHHCAKAKYVFFVDDDYYVSTRNVLRFIKDPKNYPQYLDTYIVTSVNEHQDNLFAGYVFDTVSPHRWVLSKWYVDLKEYPFSHYPPYVTAGAYILSQRSLQTLYYASIYTKYFRFDDIFLGMCAKRGNLVPFHHPAFHFTRPPYSVEGYKYVIASHGFSDPDEMHKIWEEQRSVGSA